MAAWQADFNVVPGGATMPSDYAKRLGSILPPGKHGSPECEMWGVEDGDRIDVWPSETPPEVLARFDLRSWRQDLYGQFLDFVRYIGGTIQDAEDGTEVAATLEAFTARLRSSRAARFVRDPEAYFEELRANPIPWPKEP